MLSDKWLPLTSPALFAQLESMMVQICLMMDFGMQLRLTVERPRLQQAAVLPLLHRM